MTISMSHSWHWLLVIVWAARSIHRELNRSTEPVAFSAQTVRHDGVRAIPL